MYIKNVINNSKHVNGGIPIVYLIEIPPFAINLSLLCDKMTQRNTLNICHSNVDKVPLSY